MHIETLAIHTAREVDAATGAVAPPLVMSTTFARDENYAAPHGYDIARRIELRSEGALTFNAASLYPLLYRLERGGWIEGGQPQFTR